MPRQFPAEASVGEFSQGVLGRMIPFRPTYVGQTNRPIRFQTQANQRSRKSLNP